MYYSSITKNILEILNTSRVTKNLLIKSFTNNRLLFVASSQDIFLAVGVWEWEFPTRIFNFWQEIFIQSKIHLVKWYKMENWKWKLNWYWKMKLKIDIINWELKIEIENWNWKFKIEIEKWDLKLRLKIESENFCPFWGPSRLFLGLGSGSTSFLGPTNLEYQL